MTEIVTQDHQLVLRMDREMAEELESDLSVSDDEPEEESDGAGKKLLAVIQGIFAPILTPLAGAGILQGIIILLLTLGIVSEGTAEEGVLSTISDAVFYFMPILLAAMAQFNVFSFFELPIRSVQYANSVIPIILIVWAQSYIERGLKKIMPDLLAPVLNPLFILVLGTLLGLSVLGPIGTVVADAIATVLNYFNGTVPWLVPTIVGTLSPFIIMAGVHYSLFPAATLSIAALGYETILGPGLLAGNMAHAGVALAVALKTKNQAYRSFSVSATVMAMMGVSQPALYGIELILKRPLYAVLAAGGIGGLYAGIMTVRAFAFANPSIAEIPVFLDSGNNLMHTLLMVVISFAAGFALTWVLGFEEPSQKVVDQATAGS
ncbi:PTS transporter subunit EIIC [Atopococcus tabaci]|uniref:PTS transporter subunit EIIC n=1 Tax=Atopococcus tabaci TaxID=269774 RepID=UPI00041CA877|nr:PTS transporter subunit EIIC [Atopococcus tabaci]